MAAFSEIALDHLLLAAAVGYLLGSIPFGLLLTRLAGRGELRKLGSGNIGATNVFRSGSKLLALLTLLLDIGKGAAAAAIGLEFGFPVALIAGGSAILGQGGPADLVLFDLEKPFRFGDTAFTAFTILVASTSGERFRSKSKNSPFDKRPVQGIVLRTVSAGRPIFDHLLETYPAYLTFRSATGTVGEWKNLTAFGRGLGTRNGQIWPPLACGDCPSWDSEIAHWTTSCTGWRRR